MAPQLFVFNDQWQSTLTYPSGPSPAPICDLQLADLRGDDGLALYAGFVGEAGLHAVSLDGQLRWRNKVFANVVSVAVAYPADELSQPKLLLTGEDGTILGVNRFGNEEPRKTVGKRPIARIAAAHFHQGAQASWMGLSGDLQGSLFAVGIDARLRERWSYPLPPQIHQVPIEPVTSGIVLAGNAAAWVFAAADGSIHVVSEDGEFTDAWSHGAPLTGIAAARINEFGVVIVSSPQDGVTAWALE